MSDAKFRVVQIDALDTLTTWITSAMAERFVPQAWPLWVAIVEDGDWLADPVPVIGTSGVYSTQDYRLLYVLDMEGRVRKIDQYSKPDEVRAFPSHDAAMAFLAQVEEIVTES